MVGLFPLDLRSELKQRIGGGKAGFALKKSSTNIDVRKQEVMTTTTTTTSAVPIPTIKNDLLRSVKMRKQQSNDSDDDEDAGVENLSFKEKLQLIERSSSRSLVNPL